MLEAVYKHGNLVQIIFLPRHAMTSTVCTVVLVALAIMASGGSAASSSAAAGEPGPGRGRCGPGFGVTRFICVKCTETGQLSSHGLFLNRASVRRHIAGSKPCNAAQLGFREIQVRARAGDVMAGGGGAAGPAPSIRHQAPGEEDVLQYHCIYTFIITCIICMRSGPIP